MDYKQLKDEEQTKAIQEKAAEYEMKAYQWECERDRRTILKYPTKIIESAEKEVAPARALADEYKEVAGLADEQVDAVRQSFLEQWIAAMEKEHYLASIAVQVSKKVPHTVQEETRKVEELEKILPIAYGKLDSILKKPKSVEEQEIDEEVQQMTVETDYSEMKYEDN